MQITARNELELCLTVAARVGCEPEQMARFIHAGYVPLARSLEFHAAAIEPGVELVGYGGSRGEAKSHAIIAQAGIDDCQKFDGMKWLYLRKIQKSAGEQFEDLMSKVLGNVPHKYTRGILRFSNGSRFIIGGYRSENDIDAYIGVEYDGIILEDATTLTKSKFDRIRGSLRTSKEGWRPKLYASAKKRQTPVLSRRSRATILLSMRRTGII
jgi:hypothetical protein